MSHLWFLWCAIGAIPHARPGHERSYSDDPRLLRQQHYSDAVSATLHRGYERAQLCRHSDDPEVRGVNSQSRRQWRIRTGGKSGGTGGKSAGPPRSKQGETSKNMALFGGTNFIQGRLRPVPSIVTVVTSTVGSRGFSYTQCTQVYAKPPDPTVDMKVELGCATVGDSLGGEKIKGNVIPKDGKFKGQSVRI